MCTVTIVPLSDAGGVRIVCNRDENRARPVALPPQMRRIGNRSAIMPIDPVSDGTWIAANDAGLACTLLNVHAATGSDRPSATRRSRGLIIPMLLAHDTLGDALAQAAKLDPRDFQAFRLLILTTDELAEVHSDGTKLRINPGTPGSPTDRPMMFTSSGLGDHHVQTPRQELFNSMLADGAMAPRQQDVFHSHHWPDRPHLSVGMSRADACTVSRTTIELRRSQAQLTYQPLTGSDMREHTLSMTLTAAAPSPPALRNQTITGTS